ncbi:UPF0481 protein At3g47200-like [Juglans microcarpa x Juglans regia]|uniref:UPF0481 protein At3g47200-like n=1 Tax=Juglans microcarpa x Juglans regia TaxID=2249226 RepID=UPI001B7EC0D2|nr:UPF0481 protein At3g47200-like [Juglans microcarpa x Juglans regia]XP_040999070.1 UPF0481 protein At3g47200-like [Juglans microcarpa x Juglans regia]
MAEESAAMVIPEETINVVTNINEHQGPTWLVEKIKHAKSIALNRPSRRTILSIYRVPHSLRELNKEVYTPQVISIGPFHYRSQKLQSMEIYKLRYFRRFMERITKINRDEMLASIIQDSEERVRGCYAEAISFDSDTLRQIILVDATFIIEFFLRAWSVEFLRDDGSIEAEPWALLSWIKSDLILLENQLPFFIIEKLYELLPLDQSPSIYPSSFLELTFNFFEFMNIQLIRHDEIDSEEVLHFVDLLRYFYLPPDQNRLPNRSFKVVHKMYCASQLAEAGLKFKASSSGSILDLKLNEGVLEIPRFTLRNATEIYARNLMALEQCVYQFERYVTDYFMMLDFLTNTGKDVDLLIQQGILVNEMGTNNIRPPFAGNLCTGISFRDVSDDYYDICRQLVDFHRKHWYVILKSSLKHDYFRTPWMGAATIGAIILLIFTLIQTVCAVISTFK